MPALAYFLTFTTYGTWLHGRDPGSVDRNHNEYGTPVLPVDPAREQECRERMKEPPYQLDAPRRKTVLETIQEVLRHRGWRLWAVHVRSNHVHLVVTAAAKPEKVMSDVKAWCSRRLKERHGEEADRTRWTQHGSTRYLMTEEAFQEEVRYVILQQGKAMEMAFDPELLPMLTQEPEA
jgi:REP element-mobilizing transposase RayT